MVAASRGRITRFRTDLTKHDKAFLRDKDPARPFVWCLRDSGTHLAFVDSDNLNDPDARKRLPPHTYPKMVAEAFRPYPVIFYKWDGLHLTQLESEQAATDWCRSVMFCTECDAPRSKAHEACHRCSLSAVG